jgi:hypothetical protein
MKNFFILLITTALMAQTAFAQVILNAYARVVGVSGATVTVDNVNEANAAFAVNGKVILIQMQDDVIGGNTADNATFGNLASIQSAGLFEVRTIIARAGVVFTLDQAPAIAFHYGPNASAQMVSFPHFGQNFTTSANITGLSWNGFIGGVIALEADTITLRHNISANAIGFRGGAPNNDNSSLGCMTTVYRVAGTDLNYAFKGEGIYKVTNTLYHAGRGKILNGGGGGSSHNSGGAGGSNWSSGGDGGLGYPNCTGAGGLGGLSLSPYISASRVFMGGGAGAGEGNQNSMNSGGNGGGITLVKAIKIKTSTPCSAVTISANGANGNPHNISDGCGGGGGGGSVILQVNEWLPNAVCPITVTSNGGNGSSVNHPVSHGGGGAGSQGVIIFSCPIPTQNTVLATANGLPGCNNNVGPGCNSPAGSAGGVNNTGILGGVSGSLPAGDLQFTASEHDENVTLNWEAEQENGIEFYIVERSSNSENWTLVGKVAKQFSNGGYDLEDDSPEHGWQYYRLRQMDANGGIQREATTSVFFHGETRVNFEVFPNPTKGSFTVMLSEGLSKQSRRLEIFNTMGMIELEDGIEAGQPLNIDFEMKAAGVYYIRLAGITKVQRLVLLGE